jgi:hypothetical protein
LEQAAIEQYMLALCMDEMFGAGNGVGCAEKSNFRGFDALQDLQATGAIIFLK